MSGIRAGRVALCALMVHAAGCRLAPEAPPPGLPSELRTERFHLRFEEGSLDAGARAALLAELERSLAAVEADFSDVTRPGSFGTGRAPALDGARLEPIQVRVVLSAGRCFTDARGIELVASHRERHHATHELIHYLFGPSWHPVDEGLACYLTERLCGPIKQAGADLRTVVALDLERFRSLIPERLDRQMSRVDYDAAASFVKYLIETFGWARFFDLYRGVKRNYHGAFGRSEQELFSAWRERLGRLDLRRTRAYYRFRARSTIGLQEAGAPPSQRRAEGEAVD